MKRLAGADREVSSRDVHDAHTSQLLEWRWFRKGALVGFRGRLVALDLDRRPVERAVALVRAG
jgi:hypothetical protein